MARIAKTELGFHVYYHMCSLFCLFAFPVFVHSLFDFRVILNLVKPYEIQTSVLILFRFRFLFQA